MTKLGIVLPSNNPEEFHHVMGESIVHLKPMLKKVEVHFLFHLQAPWTMKERLHVDSLLTKHGFGAKFLFTKSPKTPVAMAGLRGTAADLLPDAFAYMLADDNLQFMPKGTPKCPGGSAQRYLQVIDYMTRFERCGTVMCEGSLGGSEWGLSIRPTKNGLIATSRGLFFRNLGALYSKEEMAIPGSLEETYPAFRLMSEGYYVAKQFNNPTRHIHRHQFSDQGLPDTHITNYQKVIVPNGERYVRERYEDPSWTHEARYFPQRVWHDYVANGGSMDVFLKRSKYWRDYQR